TSSWSRRGFSTEEVIPSSFAAFVQSRGSFSRRARSTLALALHRLFSIREASCAACSLLTRRYRSLFSLWRIFSRTGRTVFSACAMVEPYRSFIQAASDTRRDSVVSSPLHSLRRDLIFAGSYFGSPDSPVT